MFLSTTSHFNTLYLAASPSSVPSSLYPPSPSQGHWRSQSRRSSLASSGIFEIQGARWCTVLASVISPWSGAQKVARRTAPNTAAVHLVRKPRIFTANPSGHLPRLLSSILCCLCTTPQHWKWIMVKQRWEVFLIKEIQKNISKLWKFTVQLMWSLSFLVHL